MENFDYTFRYMRADAYVLAFGTKGTIVLDLHRSIVDGAYKSLIWC